MRFTGYFINIAAVFIPLFGFYSAFYLGKPEDYQISKKWYLLLIPACFLSMLALTNDLHHFLYYIVPEEPQPNLYFHPYIGTYIIYIWGLSIISYQMCIRDSIQDDGQQYSQQSLVSFHVHEESSFD